MMNWLKDALGEPNVKILFEGARNLIIVAAVAAIVAYGKRKSNSDEIEYDKTFKVLGFSALYKMISFLGILISAFFIYATFFAEHKNVAETVIISAAALLIVPAMVWLFWVVWFYRLKWNEEAVFISRWPFQSHSILFNEFSIITSHPFAQMYKIRSKNGVAKVFVGQSGVAVLRDDIKRLRPDLVWEWLA